MKKTIGFSVRLFLTAVFAALTVAPVYGQLPLSEGPTKENSQSDADRDLEERIAYQRMLASLGEKQAKKRDAKLALAELQEDFKKIQVANLEMIRTLSKGGTPDLKFFADSAAEIKKRAARLKVNLVLPEPENKEEKRVIQDSPMSIDQLKRSILNLGKLVYNFVKSPFFREIDVVNPDEGKKVRQNLDDIIELSERIKKNSQTLSKFLPKQE